MVEEKTTYKITENIGEINKEKSMLEKETPMFIKIENYKEVIELMRMIRKKIEEAKINLERIYNIKNEEDIKIEEWDDLLRDVEKRIIFIDDVLLESKG